VGVLVGNLGGNEGAAEGGALDLDTQKPESSNRQLAD